VTLFCIPSDENVAKKQAGKTLNSKYKLTEMDRMWGVKEKVIPIITGENGSLSRPFPKY
jgi:hypothetical protein